MATSKTDLEGSIQEHDKQIDKKVTQEGQNTKDYVRKVLTNTSFKYLGISFLLTYHYILWFIPDSFFGTELLNDQVTEAWLVNLLAGSITMLFTAFAIKRGTHLSDNKNLAYGIPVGLALCSVTLQYLPGFLPTNLSMYVLACVAGGLEGLMLILWGECLTRMHAQFSMPHIGMVFSGTLFVLVLIGLALPTVLVPMFTAALVVVSGMLLVYEEKQETRDFPVLLPKSTTKPALSNAIVICFIGFLVGAACYYLAAIIPWENLPLEQSSFVVGVITMGACFFVASAATNYLKQQYGIFKMFPWFLVLTILAFCLFIADGMFSTPAFLMSLVISCVLEISLLVYFGILVKRGFFPPAISFALSIGCARMGIAAGNALAVFYERTGLASSDVATYTCLGFICLIAIAQVPMSKRESNIVNLISAPASPAQVDVVCNQIIDEFALSEREGEILRLIARGNTASNIASKLVISPHTVNTHIRHIYEKANIHKRSELIEYINMRKSDN